MNVTSLKTFTNLQTNYMFFVNMPNNTVFTNGANFTILARETTILEKTRTFTQFRFLGRQKGLPQAIEHVGEWSVTVVLDESAGIYDNWVKWFYYMDKFNNTIEDYKVDIVIQLLNLNGSTTNSCYALLGAVPKNTPTIDGLNQENTEGHITFECTFNIDDVAHGTVSNNVITWTESDGDIYFPYKSRLKNLTLLNPNVSLA